MTETAKTAVLEKAVLFSSPEELSLTCKKLGTVEKSSRALGFACHFRGVEWVKVLVDNGVVFRTEDMGLFRRVQYLNFWKGDYYTSEDDFMFSLLDPKTILHRASYDPVYKGEIPKDSLLAFNEEVDAISEEERLKCVRYFIRLNDKKVCDLERLLYLAITHCDHKVTELLREKGIRLPQRALKMLTGREDALPYRYSDFCDDVTFMTAEEFAKAAAELAKDLDENMSISVNTRLQSIFQKGLLYEPEALDQIIAHFDTKILGQKRTMEEFVLLDRSELLAVCEKHGWLSKPKKRDELIKFAADNEKTECTAWLLDFKNNTADLVKEQEKAEKKLMRELNADPNSVTELKKLWGFEKRNDGGIVITRYKGKQTEMRVPDRIGKDIVREIGEYAFSPRGARLTAEQKKLRKSITKVTLPETVTEIEPGAFYDCYGLTSVNIPKAVRVIDNNVFTHCTSLSDIDISGGVEITRSGAFYGCKNLMKIDIPDSVKEIGSSTFNNCEKISEIHIPSSVKQIGVEAFCSCKSLVSADILGEITAIEIGCFAFCDKLQRVTLPPTVRKIRRMAFGRCLSLEEIIIPEGVNELGESVFLDCPKLRSVVFPKSLNKIRNTMQGEEQKSIFSGRSQPECKDLTVTVPADSFAEEYCRSNNIHYIIKDNMEDK